MAYGKALSTYRRVNKIKRSSESIAEARSMINEQRAKAVDKARDIQDRQNMANAVSNAIQTGAAYGMSQSNRITPETAKKVSAGLGGVAAIGTTLATPMSQDEFLGLSSEEYRNIVEQTQPDVAGGAISGYGLQSSLEEIRKRKEAGRAIEGFSEDERGGFSKDQLFTVMDEVDFEKGKGYDFSRLPEIAEEIRKRRMTKMGLLKPEQPEESEFDLMNSIDYIKNNQFNTYA